MKKRYIITIAICAFFIACITTKPTAPLKTPVVNKEHGYSYQSPIDPAEFKDWELVKTNIIGQHPMYGLMADEYRKNPDATAVFIYVDCFYAQVMGLVTYCLVDKNLVLHAYRLEQETSTYIPAYDKAMLEAFKKDIDLYFGIESIIPTGA